MENSSEKIIRRKKTRTLSSLKKKSFDFFWKRSKEKTEDYSKSLKKSRI